MPQRALEAVPCYKTTTCTSLFVPSRRLMVRLGAFLFSQQGSQTEKW
jgi:hypothetical protein